MTKKDEKFEEIIKEQSELLTKMQSQLDQILKQHIRVQLVQDAKTFATFLSENVKHLLEENHWYFSLYMRLKYDSVVPKISRKDYLNLLKAKNETPPTASATENTFGKIKEFVKELVEVARKEKSRYTFAHQTVSCFF